MARQTLADEGTTRVLWDELPEQRERVSARERAPRGADDDALGARMVDLEIKPESPFLRAQKRVPVRRGPVTRKAANRLRKALIAVVLLAAVAAAWMAAYGYGEHAARFRIASSDQIALAGNQHVSRAQILEVFGSDIGRNTFFVPLEKRRQRLEQIAWVETASVMRLLPDRISVQVTERVPIAFAQVGSQIQLMDADGVLLDTAAVRSAHYSFPVIAGMSEAEPRSTRAARMKIYQRLMRELDSGGARYSQDISEVDLSDPEDLKVTVADANGAVLLHLGDANFLERFQLYMTHAEGWRRQFHKLNSVDLRFEQQVVVNPDVAGQAPAAETDPLPAAAQAPKPAPVHPAVTKKRAARWHPLRVRRWQKPSD
jgi:cell division protein FtsQ